MNLSQIFEKLASAIEILYEINAGVRSLGRQDLRLQRTLNQLLNFSPDDFNRVQEKITKKQNYMEGCQQVLRDEGKWISFPNSARQKI